jgi:AraC-like DNA-binding protein
MSEIALAAGFSDQSHFNRSFKRETGVSPTQYRDAQRSA